MVYNLSLYDNATGIMGIFEATNYMSNGILAILFVLSLTLLSFWILVKNNNHPVVGLSISALGCLFISLILRVRVFMGNPIIPDWFLMTNIVVLAFSIAGLYLIKNR